MKRPTDNDEVVVRYLVERTWFHYENGWNIEKSMYGE
jgi:hypothetical protein